MQAERRFIYRLRYAAYLSVAMLSLPALVIFDTGQLRKEEDLSC
jgi:hypothetical protein